MDKDRLYELLDIEEPEDFQYFENIAALLETDEEIDYDVLYALLSAVDRDVLAQLIHDYFEELADYIPDDATELYLLLDKVKLALIGMSKNADEENVRAALCEELLRFGCWYARDLTVVTTAIGSEEEEVHTVRDAIALARLEKLEGDKYSYDFSDAVAYPLDEYSMSFADMIAQSTDD